MIITSVAHGRHSMQVSNPGEVIASLLNFCRARRSAIRRELSSTAEAAIRGGGQNGQTQLRRLRAIQRCERLLYSLYEIDWPKTPNSFMADSLFSSKVIYQDCYYDDDGGAWGEFLALETYLFETYGIARTFRVLDVRNHLKTQNLFAETIKLKNCWTKRELDDTWASLLEFEATNPTALGYRAAVGMASSEFTPLQAYSAVLVANELNYQTKLRLLSSVITLHEGVPLASEEQLINRIAFCPPGIRVLIYATIPRGPTVTNQDEVYLGMSFDIGDPESILVNIPTTTKKEIDGAIKYLQRENFKEAQTSQTISHLEYLGKEMVGKLLNGSPNTVQVFPVSSLWSFPFESMIVESKIIGLEYALIYPDTIPTRPVVELEINRNLPSPPVAVGACDYDLECSFKQRVGIKKFDHLFEPLPFSDEESKSVARILNGVLLQEADAKKYKIVSLQSPKILHFATHAFFIDGDYGSSANGDLFKNDLDPGYINAGVVLTGANAYINESGNGTYYIDGILTEFDVAIMDLTATKLVALSCCDAGKSEIDDVSGPNGLVRAFRYAGTKAVLSALSPVGDVTASRLCQKFYEIFVSGTPLSTALFLARKHLFNEDGSMDYFLFTLFGSECFWGMEE